MKELIEKIVAQLVSGDPAVEETIREIAELCASHVPALADAIAATVGPFVMHQGLAKMRAESTRTLFNAYLDAGFTEEQAIALTVNAKESMNRAIQQDMSNSASK